MYYKPESNALGHFRLQMYSLDGQGRAYISFVSPEFWETAMEPDDDYIIY